MAGLLLSLSAISSDPAGVAATVPSWLTAGPGWTVQQTPTPTRAYVSEFAGVSCASATACIAVGYADKNPKTQLPVAIAETWNGTVWSVQSIPKPAGSAFSTFGGVSCTSATACTAVGESSGDPLAERWNGTTWSIQSLPYPARAYDADLNAVSCTSATACTAVGAYYVANSLHYTLAYTWNGTAWSIQPTPNPQGAGGRRNVNNGTRLEGVSCLSVTMCTAVGLYVNNAQDEFTLAERWNGTTWSIQPTPNREAITVLDGVSCISATTCTATGLTENHQLITKTLAEAWNGTSWSVQTTPSAAASTSLLASVSCTSATACTAAGYDGNNTLAEAWNGTTWSIQVTRNPGVSQGDANHFYGVSCTSPTACTAVGEHSTAGTIVPLAERYDGM